VTENRKDKKIARQHKTIIKKNLEIKKLNKKIEELNKEILFLNTTKKRNLKQKTRLRVKDIEEMYPVAKSTIWYFVKKEYITATKNSPRVTTFCAKEIEEFFKTQNIEPYDDKYISKTAASHKKLQQQSSPNLVKTESKSRGVVNSKKRHFSSPK
jgi:hypothetical protein